MINHESDLLATGVLPALSIIGHLLLQTLLSFVLAVLAAEKAVKKSALTWKGLWVKFLMFQLGFDSFWSTGTGLHTSIILILSEWWAACSVIRFIKIEQMEEFNESKDPLIVFKDVMEKLDSLVPFPSAKLAWSCQTEDPVYKIMFPAIYSVCLPLSLVVSTYLLSVVLMKAVVPLADKLGKPLEVVGKKKKHEKKRKKAEEKLMAHLGDGAWQKWNMSFPLGPTLLTLHASRFSRYRKLVRFLNLVKEVPGAPFRSFGSFFNCNWCFDCVLVIVLAAGLVVAVSVDVAGLFGHSKGFRERFFSGSLISLGQVPLGLPKISVEISKVQVFYNSQGQMICGLKRLCRGFQFPQASRKKCIK